MFIYNGNFYCTRCGALDEAALDGVGMMIAGSADEVSEYDLKDNWVCPTCNNPVRDLDAERNPCPMCDTSMVLATYGSMRFYGGELYDDVRTVFECPNCGHEHTPARKPFTYDEQEQLP